MKIDFVMFGGTWIDKLISCAIGAVIGCGIVVVMVLTGWGC